MKLKDIKNGSIYYNTKKNRPERVISNTFSSSRVVTEFHGKNQSAVSTRHIRLANGEEVEKYLDKRILKKIKVSKSFNDLHDISNQILKGKIRGRTLIKVI